MVTEALWKLLAGKPGNNAGFLRRQRGSGVRAIWLL